MAFAAATAHCRDWHYPEGPRQRSICDNYGGYKRRVWDGVERAVS